MNQLLLFSFMIALSFLVVMFQFIFTHNIKSMQGIKYCKFFKEYNPNLARLPQKLKFWTKERNATMSKESSALYRDSDSTPCPLIDILAVADESIRSIEPGLICDEFAQNADIVCRLHLRQSGLESLERLACRLERSKKVPKIVYFVTFGNYEFQFRHYVSVVAAQRHVAPRALYVIGDQVPRGKYWELVLRDVPGVRFVYRAAPSAIAGHKILFDQHKSDIVRLQTILMNGGIYLDTDMVVLRSIDPILDNELSAGVIDIGSNLGNAFIAANRGNSFIKQWYKYYVSEYNNTSWNHNSMVMPMKLYLHNTSRLVDIGDRIYRPNWFEPQLLVNESMPYDWSNNYAMHIWGANGNLPKSHEEISRSNSTVNRVFRYILYGHPEPIT